MRHLLLAVCILMAAAGACFLCSCVATGPARHAPFTLARESGGPTWHYRACVPAQLPSKFKVGDMIRMRGVGIVSAQVTGRAKEKGFGAWRVVEVTASRVVFRATCEATVSSPFGYFLVNAPHAREGTVHWIWEGQHLSGKGNPVPGPALIK